MHKKIHQNMQFSDEKHIFRGRGLALSAGSTPLVGPKPRNETTPMPLSPSAKTMAIPMSPASTRITKAEEMSQTTAASSPTHTGIIILRPVERRLTVVGPNMDVRVIDVGAETDTCCSHADGTRQRARTTQDPAVIMVIVIRYATASLAVCGRRQLKHV